MLTSLLINIMQKDKKKCCRIECLFGSSTLFLNILIINSYKNKKQKKQKTKKKIHMLTCN